MAAGPCLIMALAGMAMFVLSATLPRARHAWFWSLSFVLFACEQALTAIFPRDARSFLPTATIGLLTVAATFSYLAGYQKRRDRLVVGRLISVAVLVAVVQIILIWPMGGAPGSSGRLLLPLLRVIVFAVAAAYVTPRGERPSATERSVAGMLIGLSIANLTLILLAQAHRAQLFPLSIFQHAMTVLGTPCTAAIGLFTLALIASDFSREKMRLIHTDPLTGVRNRVGFDRDANQAIARARPPRRRLSLVLVDIDRFKTVNDRFGHPAGDAALESFAHYLIDALPWPTVVGRFGGEEFALLIEGRSAADVATQADMARAGIAHLVVPGHREVALTASFGVAELLPGEILNGLYARADAALYVSKQEGRNRVSVDPGHAV